MREFSGDYISLILDSLIYPESLLTKCLLFIKSNQKERPPDITFGGHFVLKYGGEGGIRTLDTFDRIPVIECDTLHII